MRTSAALQPARCTSATADRMASCKLVASRWNQGHAITHHGRAIVATGLEERLGHVFAEVGPRDKNHREIESHKMSLYCTMVPQ
jgi:hypothetical protein